MFVSKKEAAKELGVSIQRMYQLVKEKRIDMNEAGEVDPSTYVKKSRWENKDSDEPVQCLEPEQLESLSNALSIRVKDETSTVAITTNYNEARTCADDTGIVFCAYVDPETERLYFNLICEEDLRDEEFIKSSLNEKIVFLTVSPEEIRKALKS